MAPIAKSTKIISIPLRIANKVAIKMKIPHFFQGVLIVLLQVVLIKLVVTTSAISFAKRKVSIYIASVSTQNGMPITVMKSKIARIGVTMK